MFSAFALKIIALVAMLIDHIGYLFFPKILAFRIIGRMAAPIFAFMLAEGFFHTKSKKKYLLRLTLLAFISEFAFDLTRYMVLPNNTSIKEFIPHLLDKQSFIFSLLIGFIAMIICDKIRKTKCPDVLMIPILAVFCLIGQYIKVEYGFFGIMLISGFYLCRGNKYISAIIILLVELFAVWYNGSYFQIYALLSILPVLLYSGEKGKISLKYLFYIFYPAHLIILCIIKYLFCRS